MPIKRSDLTPHTNVVQIAAVCPFQVFLAFDGRVHVMVLLGAVRSLHVLKLSSLGDTLLSVLQFARTV